MCANYVPVTKAQRLLDFFGVSSSKDEAEHDVFPSGLVPFIRLAPPGTEPQGKARFLDDGIFRFVPDFITTKAWARQTFNARSETVDLQDHLQGRLGRRPPLHHPGRVHLRTQL